MFTGPIALTISLLAIVVSGAMLAFGGEINEFARRMIIIVLVIAMIMLAGNYLTDLFGTSGTVIYGADQQSFSGYSAISTE